MHVRRTLDTGLSPQLHPLSGIGLRQVSLQTLSVNFAIQRLSSIFGKPENTSKPAEKKTCLFDDKHPRKPCKHLRRGLSRKYVNEKKSNHGFHEPSTVLCCDRKFHKKSRLLSHERSLKSWGRIITNGFSGREERVNNKNDNDECEEWPHIYWGLIIFLKVLRDRRQLSFPFSVFRDAFFILKFLLFFFHP